MTGENQWIQQTTKECQDLFLHYEILQASNNFYPFIKIIIDGIQKESIFQNFLTIIL